MKKYLFIGAAVLVLIASVSFLSGGPAIAEAASQGALYPGTAVNDTGTGSVAWTNPTNALTDNGTNATWGIDYHDGSYDKNIRIVKGGVIGATNKSAGAYWPNTAAYATFGTASDKWGETWTATDINDSTFGFAISGEDPYGGGLSNYLKTTNFGFSIPAGATIDGIIVEVKRSTFSDGPFGSADQGRVDAVRITVHYTASSPASITSDVVFFE